MQYELRDINQDDKHAIYSLKKESIKPYVEKIWGWNEEYQRLDFEESFVLDNFQKIIIDELFIGFIETQEDDNKINLTEIHITPTYQGLGIGSHIIKTIVSKAKGNNKSVALGCFKDNLSAVNLYKRLGFDVTNETETHYELHFTHPC